MAANVNVVTPPGRLSFPALDAPESYQGSAPMYSATILWDRGVLDGDPVWHELVGLIEDEAQRAFRLSVSELRDAAVHNPIRRGQEKPKLEHYQGQVFAKATSKFEPRVVDADNIEVNPADRREVYPGRWCRLRVSAWSWKTASRGIGLRLIAVQLLNADEGEDEGVFNERATAEPFGDLPYGFSKPSGRRDQGDAFAPPEDDYRPPTDAYYPAANEADESW